MGQVNISVKTLKTERGLDVTITQGNSYQYFLHIRQGQAWNLQYGLCCAKLHFTQFAEFILWRLGKGDENPP